jgi:formate-dependent nitrite reductase membrane component NrfD|tara:strand:+ start:1851 stop:2744 length:894 start_codon:yes stop_codon:yes gene_type:complete
VAIEDKVFSGDSLRVGYRFQRHWDNSMAYAFFCAEMGAGLVFVSVLMNSMPGIIIGLIPVVTGKPFFHLAHMGVPARSWRAAIRPDRSWISRGLLGLSAMVGSAVLLLGCLMFGEQIGIASDGFIVLLLKAATLVFAVVTMTYQGFAMSHSSAIAIWNSAILPLASFLYSASTGVALAMLIESEGLTLLARAQLLLLLPLAIMHWMLLHAAWNGSPGARTSAELLLQTLYAKWFWLLVIAIGIVIPAILLWFGGDVVIMRAIIAGAILAGFLAWRILIFKIGVFEPIMSMNPFSPLR